LLLWKSSSVDPASTNQTERDYADVLVGMGVNYGALVLLAYGRGSDALAVDIEEFQNNLFVDQRMIAAFAGNVIGMIGITLEEINGKGKTVGTPISLSFDCNAANYTSKNGRVAGMTCTRHEIIPAEFTVKIAFVASDEAGILQYGYTPVSPRSYNMIVEVPDYKFASVSNHLRLKFGFLFPSKSGDIKGDTVVVQREDQEDLYGVISHYAVINGERVKVDAVLEKGDGIGIPGLVARGVQTAFGSGGFSYRIAQVDFPKGKNNFIYDPAIGVGANVYHASASTAALSILAALASFLAFVLAF